MTNSSPYLRAEVCGRTDASALRVDTFQAKSQSKTPPVARLRIRFAILRCDLLTVPHRYAFAALWFARISPAGSVRGLGLALSG